MIIIVIKRMKKNSTVTLGLQISKPLERNFEGLKLNVLDVHTLVFQAKNVLVSPLVFCLLRIMSKTVQNKLLILT